MQENKNLCAPEERIKELTEENEALFEQLHIVQEELERYYHKLKECEQRQSTAVPASVVAHSPEAIAENQKLQALVAQQKVALTVVTQNSLESRLGNMLIQGVSSKGSLLALPGKLRKMWKAQEQTTPPSELGGKSFTKVLDAYGKGGMEAVEKVLDSVFISHAMRANAYTTLARHLMTSDLSKAAEIAHLAWETDPRPYRLKWLAFRVHDAGDAVKAEAMLSMLPENTSMSESEERQAVRIRHESKQARMAQAKKLGGSQQTSTIDSQKLAKLTKEVEERKIKSAQLSQQVSELQKSVAFHKNESQKLQYELDSLNEEHKKVHILVESQKTSIENKCKQVEKIQVVMKDHENKIFYLEKTKAELEQKYNVQKEILLKNHSELVESTNKQLLCAREKSELVIRIYSLQDYKEKIMHLDNKIEQVLSLLLAQITNK